MKTLVIDTTSEICGVAILEDENLSIDNSINNGFTHSENLMPLVKEALEKTQITLNEIDLVVCCTGPGSFTGIRIGIASCKAICEVNNLKIAEVTSLESLAKNIKNFSETKISLIDARNNECYCGIFDNAINLKEGYIADNINVLIEKFQSYPDITFIGNGSLLHKELISEKINGAKFCDDNLQNSYSCGLVGLKKYNLGQLVTPDELLPNYLRKSRRRKT